MTRKKIAFLTEAWNTDILEPVIEGIRERLKEKGWDLHVFMCYPAFGLNNPDNFASYNIFSLPNYDEYEGLLLSFNSVEGYEMLKTYHPNVLKTNKPMISLEKEMDGLPTVFPDGYKAVYQLVDHLINHHGCRTLNYVGGATEHADNILRKKAFKEALAVNGIPVEDRRIRDYSFVPADGRQAYQDFKQKGLETPDAVVCANDAMALGYCQAAEEDGKCPPDDFIITGYDNDENSQNYTPKITSVDKKERALGYVACDNLLRLIDGQEVESQILYEPELVLRGSCGCFTAEEQEEFTIRDLNRKVYEKLREEGVYQEKVSQIRQELALATTEGMYNYYMAEILRGYDLFGFCMCINQDVYYSTLPINEEKWEVGFEDKQYVFSSMWEKHSQEEAVLIDTKQLLPEYLQRRDDETHVYMFMPIYRGSAGVGYIAIVDGLCLLKRNLMIELSLSVNTSYYNLRNMENLRKINKRLDNVYTRDALTGLYNRFGYMRDGYELYERSKAYRKPLMVMFMDMDGLKMINDTFGHSHGDEALIRFAEVLKQCVDEHKIAIRYGGDEFMIIGMVEGAKEAEEFKKKFESFLADANNQGYVYQLETSIGYVLTDPRGKKDLDTYVNDADALMYEVKKRNRKQRQ